jgi:catechol 2,3-dioxygenase-like lactoylglutathione lyase family enzyme
MRLQHLGINVSDPETFIGFLTTFLDLRESVRTKRIAMLEDAHGFVLAVSLLPTEEEPTYPPDFHLGFYVTEQELRDAHRRMVEHGHAPTEIALTHGSLKFFVTAPGDILIEVSVPPT